MKPTKPKTFDNKKTALKMRSPLVEKLCFPTVSAYIVIHKLKNVKNISLRYVAQKHLLLICKCFGLRFDEAWFVYASKPKNLTITKKLIDLFDNKKTALKMRSFLLLETRRFQTCLELIYLLRF